ncbi:hypothetical protein LEP1GSC082_1602 [Leptospira kirschneri str. H2]|uniref:Uncharacterized protein n=1 Tax=Leptospira kirschneri str. H1 TaxID=1049966 RepID=A0A0E2AXW4_9LEPT|nr:hypothetical protein LEP1GSC081_2979 [Leptospira kirschneri str. H1]EKO58645.1 hypothetical protein LEP1GSC082_1602 [Leptospira kirschneri str. H2]
MEVLFSLFMSDVRRLYNKILLFFRFDFLDLQNLNRIFSLLIDIQKISVFPK